MSPRNYVHAEFHRQTIEKLHARIATLAATEARLREAIQQTADVLENGRASDGWVIDKLRAALKGEGEKNG